MPVFLGITNGVTQQVSEHPCYLLAIHKQFRHLLFWIFHLNLDIELIGLHLIRLDGIFYQFDRFRYLRYHLQLAGFHLRHIKKLACNPQQAVGIFPDTFRKLFLFLVQSAHTVVL